MGNYFKKSIPWLFVTFVLFQNLSMHFVEGDDASTILYHVLGRNADFQKPYSAYHSFFDFLLSAFPASKINLLISAALTFSVLGGLLTLWAMEKLTDKGLSFFLLVLLLAQPEWLWMFLYINPAILAMGLFVMAFFLSHLYKANPNAWKLIAAAILFGLSIAIRWSFILGFFTFLPFLLVNKDFVYHKFWLRPRVLFGGAFFWFFPLSLSLAILFVAISGYSLRQFFEILLWGKSYISDYQISPAVAISDLSGYFTIATGLLFFAGIYACIKSKSFWILLVLGFSVLPFLILGFDTSFKYNLTLMPGVVLLMHAGWKYLQKVNVYLKYAFFLILAAPWFIGIQVSNNSVAWGPGLELQYKKPTESIQQAISFSLNAGLAMPNAEGVRPLFGYVDALLLGSWKRFNQERTDERVQLAIHASNQNCLLFSDRPVALVQMAFFQYGFEFMQPEIDSQNNIWKRTMRHPSNGVETILMTPGDFTGLNDFSEMIAEQKRAYQKSAMIYLTYPSLMKELVAQQPDFMPKSAVTGLLF